MSSPKKHRKPLRLTVLNRSLSFTSFGARFIFICLAIGVAAINTGNNLLYLIVAMLLSLMIVSGIMSEHALRGIVVSRRLPDDIYAGTPFPVRYILHNTKRRIPSFALTVSARYPGGATGPGAFVPRLAPGESGHGEVTEEVAARGGWVCSGYEVATLFPFGLFRKMMRIPHEEVVTVYPRIRALDEGLVKDLVARAGETSVRRRGHGAEIRSLREYQPFDEARLIHWKSSARLATLMAKEFEADEKKAVCVILDNLAPEDPSPGYHDRFEEAVSLAASVVRLLMAEAGLPVSLVSRGVSVGQGTGEAHYRLLMETLATITYIYGEGPPGLFDSAVAEGIPVLVVAERGFGWAGRSGEASLFLEAGR